MLSEMKWLVRCEAKRGSVVTSSPPCKKPALKLYSCLSALLRCLCPSLSIQVSTSIPLLCKPCANFSRLKGGCVEKKNWVSKGL